jgi:WD40 repeat protein
MRGFLISLVAATLFGLGTLGSQPAPPSKEQPDPVFVPPDKAGKPPVLPPGTTVLRKRDIQGVDDGGTTEVYSAAFSANGQLLLTGYWNQPLKKETKPNDLTLWNADTGEPLRSWRGHDERVVFVAFLPDNERLLSMSSDGVVKVWDLLRGKEINSFNAGETGSVSGGIVSRDGNSLLTNTLKVWDVKTGKKVREFNGGGPDTIALSPDGKWLLAGNRYREKGRFLGLWHFPTGKLIRRLDEKEEWRGPVAVSPNSKQGVAMKPSETGGQRFVMWDMETGKELTTLDSPPTDKEVQILSFTADGNQLVGLGYTIHVWDVQTGKSIRSVNFERPLVFSRGLAISSDGKRAVRAKPASGFSLLIWDIPNGKLRRTVHVGP